MSGEISVIHSSISAIVPEIEVPLIRVGRDNDGGYVIPERAMEESSFLFSGGYGNDFSFEKDFLDKSNAEEVVLYDYSINFSRLLLDFLGACKSIVFRRGHYSLRYHVKNILTYCRLILTPNISLVHSKLSGGGFEAGINLSNLTTAFGSISVDTRKQFFCKLDIEGSEYELIDEIVELESKISGLVIEFHDTYGKREVFLKSLRSLYPCFAIVHTHVNNYGGISPDGQPAVYEISFLNRRLSLNLEKMPLPFNSLVPQDQPNNPDSAEISLIFRELT